VFTTTEYNSIPYQTPTVEKTKPVNVTSKRVEKIMKGLNTSKAMGPDSIHPRILKELSCELADTLAHFFQQSIDNGSTPEEWKTAYIFPLFKKNDRSIPSNYRPVSLTCICYKMLEHIICSNLMTHFEEKNILNSRQHAFRKHK